MYLSGRIVSDSMHPLLCVNDVIILNRISFQNLSKGDIVSVCNNHKYYAHRIIRKYRDAFYTKGDNNTYIDSVMLHPGNYVGKVKYRMCESGLMDLDTDVFYRAELYHKDNDSYYVYLLSDHYLVLDASFNKCRRIEDIKQWEEAIL